MHLERRQKGAREVPDSWRWWLLYYILMSDEFGLKRHAVAGMVLPLMEGWSRRGFLFWHHCDSAWSSNQILPYLIWPIGPLPRLIQRIRKAALPSSWLLEWIAWDHWMRTCITMLSAYHPPTCWQYFLKSNIS